MKKTDWQERLIQNIAIVCVHAGILTISIFHLIEGRLFFGITGIVLNEIMRLAMKDD